MGTAACSQAVFTREIVIYEMSCGHTYQAPRSVIERKSHLHGCQSFGFEFSPFTVVILGRERRIWEFESYTYLNACVWGCARK